MLTTPFRHAAVTLLAAGLLVLTACGPTTQNAPTGGATPGTNRQGGGQTGRLGGVSGLIVAISGKTLQVRTTAGQSAVSYTSKTTITQEQKAAAAAAKVGMCAVVRSAAAGSSASPGATITAASVSLTAAAGGTCQAGFGGGPRPAGAPSGGPAGGPAGPPSGVPSGDASGRPDGRRGQGGFGAVGKIVSRTGDTLVIESSRTGSSDTVETTVMLTATTTYLSQGKATAKEVTKGKCVFATGSADKTGATTATALRLSAATNGSCTDGRPGQANPGGSRSGG